MIKMGVLGGGRKNVCFSPRNRCFQFSANVTIKGLIFLLPFLEESFIDFKKIMRNNDAEMHIEGEEGPLSTVI